MVPFGKLPYRRPDMNELEQAMERGCKKLEAACCFEDAYYALLEMEAPRRTFSTLAVQCEAGATMDTTNEFYQRETLFFSAAHPKMTALETRMRNILAQSPWKEQLKEHTGPEPIARAEALAQSFLPGLEGELEKENNLSEQYSRLTAGLRITHGGREYTLGDISRMANSANREHRRHFSLLMENAYAKIEDELDQLYHQLAAQRESIAKKLGEASFVKTGYNRLGRSTLSPNKTKLFRGEVARHLVPAAHSLYQRQQSRLGWESLYYFDENFDFPQNEPALPEDITELFSPVFSGLSAQTDVFYRDFKRCAFYDTALRNGKIQGAYSNMLPLYGMPFIFTNYNQTPDALRTYAHECGHALHSYINRARPFIDSCNPPSELSETHSMAMEFLVWPHLKSLFPTSGGYYRYCYRHLKQALAFIPYGCAVDEFQHQVYENPSLAPAARRQLWQRLERQYLPWRRYQPDTFYAGGRFWQRQTHIYKWPFYYIDYAIAQVCAIGLHLEASENHPAALSRYFCLLEQGGQYSLEETLEKAGLPSPFSGNYIEDIAQKALEQLSLLEKQCMVE